MSWWSPAVSLGAQLLQGISPAFCHHCPWGFVVLGLVLSFCAGVCLGGCIVSLILSPLLRRAAGAALNILFSGSAPYRPPAWAEARRRLALYAGRRSVDE